MELKDLKSAWNKVSSENERKGQLPEEEFSKMLEKRTVDISDKIGRNIRIGIIIVIAWICLSVIGDYILTPLVLDNIEDMIPTKSFIFWLAKIEALCYFIIVIGIIIFWVRYNKLEKTKINSDNLKSKLELLIKILNSYKRMFYIAMGFIIIEVAVAYTSGFIEGLNYRMNDMGLDLSNLNLMRWTITIFGFLIGLGLITLICYLLFNLFFKRLYGRYLKQLKTTLKELNEPVLDSK